MSLILQNHQKIVFIGDSITDCGRCAAHAPLGSGYVRFFHDLALIREPYKEFVIVNKGISGDKITQLRDRWQDDVLREKPDVLSIKVGINDLCSHLCAREDAVSPDDFTQEYAAVLKRTRAAFPDCQLLLIEPFHLSTEPASATLWRGRVNAMLPQYRAVVAQLAAQFGARHLATQEVFEPILSRHGTESLAPESVHPHQTGHLVLALAVYEALSD